MAEAPRLRDTQDWWIHTQIDFLIAATGYAFTMVLAGFALTMTTLPKISLLPAFVAGLVRVFNLQIPGMVNTPVFLVSFCATEASVFNNVLHIFCLSSNLVAKAFARPDLLIARAALVAAFIGLFVFGNMMAQETTEVRKRDLLPPC